MLLLDGVQGGDCLHRKPLLCCTIRDHLDGGRDLSSNYVFPYLDQNYPSRFPRFIHVMHRIRKQWSLKIDEMLSIPRGHGGVQCGRARQRQC